MKTVQAVKDKIIVEPLEQEEMTPGGVIIPSTAEKDPQSYGKVVSVGEDVMYIEKGDILLFAKFAGQDMLIDERLLKVLIDNEVYGILKEEKEEE